jgi:hypothetical protein
MWWQVKMKEKRRKGQHHMNWRYLKRRHRCKHRRNQYNTRRPKWTCIIRWTNGLGPRGAEWTLSVGILKSEASVEPTVLGCQPSVYPINYSVQYREELRMQASAPDELMHRQWKCWLNSVNRSVSNGRQWLVAPDELMTWKVYYWFIGWY